MPAAAGPVTVHLRPATGASKRFMPMVSGGILLPVRKSLTKKSGIAGLPAFVGQDSLVDGGESESSGGGRKAIVWNLFPHHHLDQY
ncbi:MAG: hypothetical protein Q8L00_00320, partial [Deltaproteobacteria bacterium]|nr:hypothetical protein [Deltaproteobacteria bacterium]